VNGYGIAALVCLAVAMFGLGYLCGSASEFFHRRWQPTVPVRVLCACTYHQSPL